MNTTSDETQTGTDVMDVALRTMRKYGMNIITATQHLDVNVVIFDTEVLEIQDIVEVNY